MEKYVELAQVQMNLENKETNLRHDQKEKTKSSSSMTTVKGHIS